MEIFTVLDQLDLLYFIRSHMVTTKRDKVKNPSVPACKYRAAYYAFSSRVCNDELSELL